MAKSKSANRNGIATSSKNGKPAKPAAETAPPATMTGVRVFKLRSYVAQCAEDLWGRELRIEVDENRAVITKDKFSNFTTLGYLPEELVVAKIEVDNDDPIGICGDLMETYVGDQESIDQFMELNRQRMDAVYEVHAISNRMRSMLGGGYPIINHRGLGPLGQD